MHVGGMNGKMQGEEEQAERTKKEKRRQYEANIGKGAYFFSFCFYLFSLFLGGF